MFFPRKAGVSTGLDPPALDVSGKGASERQAISCCLEAPDGVGGGEGSCRHGASMSGSEQHPGDEEPPLTHNSLIFGSCACEMESNLKPGRGSGMSILPTHPICDSAMNMSMEARKQNMGLSAAFFVVSLTFPIRTQCQSQHMPQPCELEVRESEGGWVGGRGMGWRLDTGKEGAQSRRRRGKGRGRAR